jgi:hypothetical protein
VALTDLERKRCECDLAKFMERRRPPPDIRPKLDIGYRISGQSVEIIEIRPDWQNPKLTMEHPVAKATLPSSGRAFGQPLMSNVSHNVYPLASHFNFTIGKAIMKRLHRVSFGGLANDKLIHRGLLRIFVRRSFIIAFVTASIPCAVSPVRAAETVERPIWNLNESWTYSRTSYATASSHMNEQWQYTLVVTETNKDYYILEYSRVDSDGKDRRALQRWSTAINFMNRAGSPPNWQEFRRFRWPLAEGDSWDFPWIQPPLGDLTWTAKATGWETVTVPAGTFRAMRIEVHNSCYYPGVDGGVCGQQDLIWYSPSVKRHVRLELRSNKGAYQDRNIVEELVQYHPN